MENMASDEFSFGPYERPVVIAVRLGGPDHILAISCAYQGARPDWEWARLWDPTSTIYRLPVGKKGRLVVVKVEDDYHVTFAAIGKSSTGPYLIPDPNYAAPIVLRPELQTEKCKCENEGFKKCDLGDPRICADCEPDVQGMP